MGIAQAILRLRKEYAEIQKMAPDTINCGWCMEFAETIARQGFGKDLWGCEISMEDWSDDMRCLEDADFEYIVDCHCFIFYRGKYYDSECPQGCNYPDQLPCYQRILNNYELV